MNIATKPNFVNADVVEVQIMPEDDPNGLKEDTLPEKTLQAMITQGTHETGGFIHHISLNLHTDNRILSNHSKNIVGKGRSAHSKLSDWLNQRICCRETITSLKIDYNRSPLELQPFRFSKS
jgi:hypothetical protein